MSGKIEPAGINAAVINSALPLHASDTDNVASQQAAAVRSGLLDRCKAGDERAWEQLYGQWAGRIYRWAVLLGAPAREAEDIAQEVLYTCARRIDRCHGEKALASWLYEITRRIVANKRRSPTWSTNLAPLPENEAGTAFEHSHPRGPELELAARRCLAALPPAQAEVLVMMDIENFTREEAARILGVPAGTVASRLRLAREAFRLRWTAIAPSLLEDES